MIAIEHYPHQMASRIFRIHQKIGVGRTRRPGVPQAPMASMLTAVSARRAFSSFIITPTELDSALSRGPKSKISTSPRTIPLCAAWFMPNDPAQRTGHSVFLAQRIPSARFFDLDAVKDHDSPYPHMLPSPADFAEAMGELGIRREDEVVVYDSKELGIFSAPRVAWTLKVFGHPKVHLLNNFKVWVQEGRPTESGDVSPIEKAQYIKPDVDLSKVVGFPDMKELVKDYGKEGAEGVQILDARLPGRWAGTEPEPRAGLSSGHMPGSINMPMAELLDPESKTLLPATELRAIFERKGVDKERPIISSCGTGVTAAIIDAALSEAGYGNGQQRRIYDGSWTEWAQRVTESEGLIQKDK